jgi:hypothetical protein
MTINREFHDGLKVSLIATPRKIFHSCSPNDNLREISKKNIEKFDFMPVIVEPDTVLGVVKLADYFDVAAPAGSVSDFVEQLGERHLIGADASILDFVLSADKRPFRFVVSQDGIVGLISISDIQKFPVRPVLFSLVTALEIKMADMIRGRLPSSEAWLCHLSDGRKAKVKEEIAKVSATEGIVDALLFTQFSDKRDIISKAFLKGSAQRMDFAKTMKRIQHLRDDLAHANEYAATTAKAEEICKTARSVFDIFALLEG